MKVEILTRNVKDEAVAREFILRKVHFAMDRIASRVGKVTVRLEDETASSSAFDGLCRIEVEMHPSGHIHVSSHGESVFDCVLQAVQKMENAVKHDIDRHRRSSKIRHKNTKRQFVESLQPDFDQE